MTPDCECEKCGKIKSMHVHHECDDFGCCHPIPTQPKTVDEMAKAHAKEYESLGEAVVESAEFDFKAGFAARDAEVEGLKVTLAKTKRLTERQATRIKEADEVIGFYADPENYIERHKNGWERKKAEECELIRNYKHPGTDWVGSISVGGKRAREYQKKYGVK